ncbi:MAG: hypothetical protein WD073_04060 [Xanthobacteraceae bacterium]
MHDADTPTQQELPRILVFIIALACGLFLALAVHIGLTAKSTGLASALRMLIPTSTDYLRSALAWWAIGIAGCLGSWGTIVFLRKTSPRGPAQRLIRLVLGLAFFGLLAAAGHEASAGPAGQAAVTTGVNLAAMGLGAFMAFFAAHFAARR